MLPIVRKENMKHVLNFKDNVIEVKSTVYDMIENVQIDNFTEIVNQTKEVYDEIYSKAKESGEKLHPIRAKYLAIDKVLNPWLERRSKTTIQISDGKDKKDEVKAEKEEISEELKEKIKSLYQNIPEDFFDSKKETINQEAEEILLNDINFDDDLFNYDNLFSSGSLCDIDNITFSDVSEEKITVNIDLGITYKEIENLRNLNEI